MLGTKPRAWLGFGLATFKSFAVLGLLGSEDAEALRQRFDRLESGGCAAKSTDVTTLVMEARALAENGFST